MARTRLDLVVYWAIAGLGLAVCGVTPVAPRAVVQAQGGGENFYRYQGDDGRTVYTNAREQVPISQRASGRLDLERVSLNSEVGAELDRRYEAEHRALVETPYCHARREAADTNVIEEMVERYGALLVAAGGLVLLFLLSPWAIRQVGAPVWAKVLMMGIPSLAAVGLIGFSAMQAGRAVDKLEEHAEPCEPQTFADLSASPDPVSAHKQLIERLKQEIDAARDSSTSAQRQLQ